MIQEEACEPGADGLCHWLGNLTLLPPKVNSVIGREPYSEKVKTYRQQGLLILDEQIGSAPDSWTLQNIRDRKGELIEWAVERWSDLEV